jgi:hypothetical protein
VIAITAWCIGAFAYGLLRFPDAPYKPCASSEGYCGKFGAPHTEATYEAHKNWERTILISWPFGLAAGAFVGWRRKANKRLQATRETRAPEA